MKILAIIWLFTIFQTNLYADKIMHRSCEITLPVYNDWNIDTGEYSDFNHNLYKMRDFFKEMYDIAAESAKDGLLEKGYHIQFAVIPASTLYSPSANETYKKNYKKSSKDSDRLQLGYNVNVNSKEVYRRNRSAKKKASSKARVELYSGDHLIAMKTKEQKSNLFSSKKWQVLLEKAFKKAMKKIPKCKID